MSEFIKRKGMSYVLKKKVCDCTDDERLYKREYSRHLKEKMITKVGKNKYHDYNSKYGKQYYQLHKEKLQNLARERKAKERGGISKGRGRPNTLGINMLF